MRLLTPDLRAIVRNVYLRPQAHHLAWCDNQLNAKSPCEALNMHMRMNGDHRFLYDGDQLTNELREAGFSVKAVSYNRSRHAALRFLDLRGFGLNLALECTKPSD